MIGKITGGLLLIAGGVKVCAEWIGQKRKGIALCRELATALESMEAMIRWQKSSLPHAISQQCDRTLSGKYFKVLLEHLESKYTLQDAWKSVFVNIEVKEAADILGRLEFSGDETRVTGELHLAAQQLRHMASEHSARQREQEKLCVAVCASAVGLAIIMLI